MSSAAVASAATVTTVSAPPVVLKFPGKDAIVTYISGHPIKTYAIDVNEYVPNSIAIIAGHFENKEMTQDQVPANVRSALLANASPDQKKLNDLHESLVALTASLEGDGVGNSTFSSEIKALVPQSRDQLLEVTQFAFAQALKDLFDNATYTPPTDGSGSFVRHVQDVTSSSK